MEGAHSVLLPSTSTISKLHSNNNPAMRRFNYIIIPALFLINMGVDGVTIANTLTSAHHPIRDSPNRQARPAALLQNRQYRAADFSSESSSTTDQPALPEPVDTDDHPQDTSEGTEFSPRGSVFHSLPLGGGGVLPRGDRPAINFRQPLRRTDSGDNGENCDDALPASFEPRLDSGISMNAMSDVIPNGSTKPLSDSFAKPASDKPLSDSLAKPASSPPATHPPTSNATSSDPPASNLPAGTIGSSPMSNAVGTSNLMNSALGSGGVRDELSNFGPRDKALSHGMGTVSVVRDLVLKHQTTNEGNLEADATDPEDDDENVAEVTNESDMDDAIENLAKGTNESDSHGMGTSVVSDVKMARDATDDATDEEDINDNESDADDAADNVVEVTSEIDMVDAAEDAEDTNESDTDDDGAEDGVLESRQRNIPRRLSKPRFPRPPHSPHPSDIAVPSRVAKMEKVIKGKDALETAGESMVPMKPHHAGAEGVQHVRAAGTVF